MDSIAHSLWESRVPANANVLVYRARCSTGPGGTRVYVVKPCRVYKCLRRIRSCGALHHTGGERQLRPQDAVAFECHGILEKG